MLDQNAACQFIENRKLYQTPALVELGDLRSVTLGGSPGPTETISGVGLVPGAQV